MPLVLGYLLLLVMLLAPSAQAEESCSIKPYVPYYIVDPNGYKNIVQGSDGWVFDGQQDLMDHFAISATNTVLLKQLTSLLHSKGTELLIAYIPLRSMAVPDVFPANNAVLKERGYEAHKALQNYAALITQLNQAGVNIVGMPDLAGHSDYFKRHEPHWTATGARAMAQNLATYIKQQGWMQPVLQKPDHSLLMSGDYTKVTLLGSSYSVIPAYADGLTEYLGSASLWNAAIDGGGLDDAITAYLTSDVFRNEPPHIIIWEIAGYYDLGSIDMTTALRRAIGAVYGDCSEANRLSTTRLQLDGIQPIHFNPPAVDTALPNAAYIALDFGKQLAGSMALTFRGEDGQGVCTQLERPFLPPADGRFYYLLPEVSQASLNTLLLMPPAEMAGLKVEASICGVVQ